MKMSLARGTFGSRGAAAVSNTERLEQVRHASRKAHGVLDTIRDVGVFKAQINAIKETGMLHPVRNIVQAHTTSFSNVTESSVSASESEVVVEEDEQLQVLGLLNSAYNAFSTGQFDNGSDYLRQAAFISTCTRCVRNITEIEELIVKGTGNDVSEGRRRVQALVKLIPAYYDVMEGETELLHGETEERLATAIPKAKEESVLGKKKKITAKVSVAEEEECGDKCGGVEILEACGWNPKCMDSVIKHAEEMKARGEKVYISALTKRAESFVLG